MAAPKSEFRSKTLLRVGQTLRHGGSFGFKVESQIYTGPFSDVFIVSQCDGKTPSKQYALKIEHISEAARPVLKQDVRLLSSLAGRRGFPELVGAGRTASFKYCLMQLLGPDLALLRRFCPQMNFSPSTTLQLSVQTLRLLASLHDVGYICRDFKAANLTIGGAHEHNVVYMLDFGFARRFRHQNGQLRRQRPAAALLGTIQYAPLAAHARREQAPRDDLESWFYVIVDWLIGRLPWTSPPEQKDVHQVIYEHKLAIRNVLRPSFFKQLPAEFENIFKSIEATRYGEPPAYGYIEYQLMLAAESIRADMFEPLDWIKNPLIREQAVQLRDSTHSGEHVNVPPPPFMVSPPRNNQRQKEIADDEIAPSPIPDRDDEADSPCPETHRSMIDVEASEELIGAAQASA